MHEIILASASPRRQELMKLITPHFSVKVSQAEEMSSPPAALSKESYPLFYARAKAEDIYQREAAERSERAFPRKSGAKASLQKELVVIGCDTAVFIDGQMLEKPSSADEAFSMLRSLSGRTHEVISGCCLLFPGGREEFESRTKVTFFELSAEEILSYIESGEPMDKAGAYGIQGKGALLVREIQGDYFNVVGFPIGALRRAMLRRGIVH